MIAIGYHWSPSHRRVSIDVTGLAPWHTSPLHSGVQRPIVCFAADPTAAWSLGPAHDTEGRIESWDLWLSHLDTSLDSVEVRCDVDGSVRELRSTAAVPATYVGTRADRCLTTP